MEQVMNFFENLLSSTDWPPRWHCGKWSDFHGWLFIYSDILIWLAYFVIPAILIWFIKSDFKKENATVVLLFAGFILLCGTTHLLDALIFWVPLYRLSALFKFFTAIISMTSVFYFIKLLPIFIGKSRKVQDEINSLKKELKEKELEIKRLKNHII